MVLFENDVVRISIDKDIPCLEWVGKGIISAEEFKESEYKSLEFYKQYKKEFSNLEWYVDARLIGALDPELIAWVGTEILPEFEKNGLTKEAFVLPEDIFGQMSVGDYISTSESGNVTMQMFDNEDKAKKWLTD